MTEPRVIITCPVCGDFLPHRGDDDCGAWRLLMAISRISQAGRARERRLSSMRSSYRSRMKARRRRG